MRHKNSVQHASAAKPKVVGSSQGKSGAPDGPLKTFNIFNARNVKLKKAASQAKCKRKPAAGKEAKAGIQVYRPGHPVKEDQDTRRRDAGAEVQPLRKPSQGRQDAQSAASLVASG